MRNFAYIETRLGSDNAKSVLNRLKIMLKGKKIHLAATTRDMAPMAVFSIVGGKREDAPVFKAKVRRAFGVLKGSFPMPPKMTADFGTMPDESEEL